MPQKGYKQTKDHIDKCRNPKLGKCGVSVSNWKGGIPNCIDCGNKLKWRYAKRCIKCSNKGQNSNNWKGGITKERVKIWFSEQYKQWRLSIFERDNFTCKLCSKRSKQGEHLDLEAHHIKLFSTFPELRFNLKNGITLCRDCHNKTKRKEKDFELLFEKIINFYE